MPPPLTEITDSDLVNMAKARGEGSREAFDELVRRHQGWVVRLAVHLLGNSKDADDVAQEAFTRAFLALDRAYEKTNFGGWIRVIVTRVAFNHRRASSNRRKNYAQISAAPTVSDAPAVEARQLVDAVLDKLPYSYREVLVLRHVEGLSMEELASTLDIGLSAAKMRLKRAREQFWQVHAEVAE